MTDDRTDSEQTLRGIVIPTAWGADGSPTGVAILTRDEGEYEVAPGAASDRLLSHLRREILARTLPLPGPSGRQKVSVISFAILEWAGAEHDLPDMTSGEGR